MKLTMPTLGVISAVIALASIGGIYAIGYESVFDSHQTGDVPDGAALLMGNVKVTHFNEHGDVIGYRQGTNHITATGMAVIMAQVFTGINQTELSGVNSDSLPSGAGNNVTGRVGWMEIGTDGDGTSYTSQLAWNDTDVSLPVNNVLAGNPCDRVAATVSNTTTVDKTGGSPNHRTAHEAGSFCNNEPAENKFNCNARYNVTAVAQFQGADCSTNSIDEAGIFTTPSTDAKGLMFARNTFGSVNLGPLDTLQLEWEFTFTDS